MGLEDNYSSTRIAWIIEQEGEEGLTDSQVRHLQNNRKAKDNVDLQLKLNKIGPDRSSHIKMREFESRQNRINSSRKSVPEFIARWETNDSQRMALLKYNGKFIFSIKEWLNCEIEACSSSHQFIYKKNLKAKNVEELTSECEKILGSYGCKRSRYDFAEFGEFFS